MNRAGWLLIAVFVLAVAAFLVIQRHGRERIAPAPMGKTIMQVLPDAAGKPEVWRIKKQQVPVEKLPDLVLPTAKPRTRPPGAHTESARALDAQAMEAWKHGDLESAIAKFEAAVKADPEDAEVRTDLGRLYLVMAHIPAAGPQLERAAELKPGDAQVWLDLASYYERAELLERAFYARQRAEKLSRGAKIEKDENGFWVLEGQKVFP